MGLDYPDSIRLWYSAEGKRYNHLLFFSCRVEPKFPGACSKIFRGDIVTSVYIIPVRNYH